MPSEQVSHRVGSAGRWLLLGSFPVQDLDLFALLDANKSCAQEPIGGQGEHSFMPPHPCVWVIQGDTVSLLLEVINTKSNCRAPHAEDPFTTSGLLWPVLGGCWGGCTLTAEGFGDTR